MKKCNHCEQEFEFPADLSLHYLEQHGVSEEESYGKLLREDKTGKPDFTYIGDMYDAFARVMLRFQEGAVKYERLNFENAKDPQTYKESLSRHLMQYIRGQQDEDHLSAVAVNALILLHLEEIQK